MTEPGEQTLAENVEREASKKQADRQAAMFLVFVLFGILTWLSWLKGKDAPQ